MLAAETQVVKFLLLAWTDGGQNSLHPSVSTHLVIQVEWPDTSNPPWFLRKSRSLALRVLGLPTMAEMYSVPWNDHLKGKCHQLWPPPLGQTAVMSAEQI